MSSALFGGATTQTRSRNLVEFKAGKMHLKGTMVQPDKRKGLVYVHQSDDSLMHFCWKDRTNGIVEDDLIIFPDDVEIKKVPQCTTGRVFLMKFKSSNKKFFFWMQENETDKDEKLWKKVNDSLNNPPVPGAGSSHPSSSAASSTTASAADRLGNFTNALGDFGVDAHELQNLIGSMSEQQLQMFLGGIMPANSPSSNRSGASSNLTSNQSSRAASAIPAASATPGAPKPSTATPAATPAASTTESAKTAAATPASSSDDTSGKKMQFSEFQSILGNIATSTRSDLDLSEVLSLDVMAPILSNKQIQEKLMQHLPESDILPKTEHELRTTLSTPQFKRAMSSFSHALQSGQLGPLLQQFGLPESVCTAAQQGNLEAFAKAMEDFAKSKGGKQGKDDDAMDTK